MSIKKDFQALVELLESNKNKKVDTILPEVLELCTSKKKSKTFQVDEDGNVTHIFCYYHKEWEPVELYGKKSSSNTGYNTMCKTGVNQWTRQQTQAKKERSDLLDQVASGEFPHKDLQSELDSIEERRQRIEPLVETEVETEE